MKGTHPMDTPLPLIDTMTVRITPGKVHVWFQLEDGQVLGPNTYSQITIAGDGTFTADSTTLATSTPQEERA